MRFELSNPSVLKTVIESLSVITDECGITFTSEQVSIRALSKDHITFMTVDLKKYLFDEYDCQDGEIINVDVNQLSKIMKRCKNDDIIKGNVDDSNLHLTFQGDSTRTFSTRLIDNEYESPRPPLIDYPINLNIPTSIFNDTLGDLRIFTDVISISADNDYLIFKGDGQAGDGFIKYLHGESVQAYYQSKYSIEKLTEIMKAKGFSETVTLNFGNDLPLKLTFELVTGDGKIEFLLAPRIENE